MTSPQPEKEPDNIPTPTSPITPKTTPTPDVVPNEPNVPDSPISTPPIEDTPSTPDAHSPSAPEKSPPAEHPAETAEQIWTPIQVMERETTANLSQRKKGDLPAYDFNTVRGLGSTGRVHESTGYNNTFGGLSSY